MESIAVGYGLTHNARRVISRSKERACRKRREGGESDPEGRPDSEQSSPDRLNTKLEGPRIKNANGLRSRNKPLFNLSSIGDAPDKQD